MSEAATPMPHPTTPIAWRLAMGAGVLILGLAAYGLRDAIGPRGQAVFGMFCVIGLVAALSTNLRAVRWRTLATGFALQWLLALFVLKFSIRGLESIGIPDGFAPGYSFFEAIGDAVKKFLSFTAAGTEFVFGALANSPEMSNVFGPRLGFVFAFASTGLPVIIFVSSFFTVMYYLGVLQWLVRIFARGMIYLMGTSGAETLSAVANVFMGQTEAPLIVKPYVARMTQSELLALMVGGMATISGALMAVYIGFGADQVGILATSVMAAPCGLYLAKLSLPEMETPQTAGVIHTEPETQHRNLIDAAAGGASDGMFLAFNVAAMLIAFLAFVALIDFLLAQIPVGTSLFELLAPAQGWYAVGNAILTLIGYYVIYLLSRPLLQMLYKGELSRPLRWAAHGVGYAAFLLALHGFLLMLTEPLSLKLIFSRLFAPLAFLMGTPEGEIFDIANLLGTKLALNEFVAYQELKTLTLSSRSRILATYALTGFANFGSIGIQLGGIGAMAPERRSDLARLGMRALFVGFLATVLNAAIAGVLLED